MFSDKQKLLKLEFSIFAKMNKKVFHIILIITMFSLFLISFSEVAFHRANSEVACIGATAILF